MRYMIRLEIMRNSVLDRAVLLSAAVRFNIGSFTGRSGTCNLNEDLGLGLFSLIERKSKPLIRTASLV